MLWQKLLNSRRRLIASAFLLDIGITAIALVVQFTGIALDFSPTILGVLGALGAGVYGLSCLVSGRLADRWGRRRAALVALVLLAGAWGSLAAAPALWQLMGLVALSGAFLSLFWPSVMAWLSELTPGTDLALRRTMGVFNIAWAMGAALGPTMAGLLWDVSGRYTCYYTVVLLVVILALVGITPESVRSAPAVRSVKSSGDDQKGQQIHRLLVMTRIGMFGGWFAMGVTNALFPKLGDTLGFSGTTVGIVLSFSFAAMIIVFWAARSSNRWQHRTWPLWFATLAGMVGMIMAVVLRSPLGFGSGFILVGAYTGVGFVLSQHYGLLGPADSRAASMGINEALVGAGSVAGPMLGGLAATWFGLRAPFVLGMAVVLIAGLGQLVAWRHLDERPPGPHTACGLQLGKR